MYINIYLHIHAFYFLKKSQHITSLLHAFYTKQYIQLIIYMCIYIIYISITTFK